MSTNDSDILGLPPFVPENGFSAELNQLALSETGRSRNGIGAINQEAFKQQVVMDAISAKARYGMHRLMEMNQTAASEFNATAYSISTYNQAAHGSSYEAYLNAFTDRLMKTSAKHLLGMLEIGAASIAKEVLRSTKPNEPIGILQKLLGNGSG